jgi:hypothetical protein
VRDDTPIKSPPRQGKKCARGRRLAKAGD